MTLDFVKMQAAGNDYIYIDCFEKRVYSPQKLAVKLSKRRYGAGGDGIILMRQSKCADVAISIYNADGSKAAMCGNALRCVALYMKKFRFIRRKTVFVETQSGVREVKCLPGGYFSAEMGKAEFKSECGCQLVDVGNLHRVEWRPSVQDADFFRLNNFRPDMYNTEICRVVSRSEIEARVYERGSGETFSCGSGACAAAASGVKKGVLCPGKIAVSFPGGKLTVEVSENYALRLIGGADIVYCGRVSFDGKYDT